MEPAVQRNELRVALIGARNQIQTSLAARDAYIREGAALGLSKVELGELAGVSRQTVYDILAKEGRQWVEGDDQPRDNANAGLEVQR